MLQVLLALIPGAVAMIWIYGDGVLINIVLAMSSAVLLEAAILAMRRKPVIHSLKDHSALVSAVLLALSPPPLTPWWVIMIGMLFAIVVAKQLYGGLGFNVFNPAMAGYAVLMISFPVQMTVWPDPDLPRMELIDAIHWKFLNQLSVTQSLDAITRATPLDALRAAQRMQAEHATLASLTTIQSRYWIIGSLWLIGGCWLVYQRVAAWQLPTALLASFTLLVGVFWLLDPAQHPSPLFHLLQGNIIMAAFFILTDPVTAPMTAKGRIIGAILVAIIVFIIRNWGGYPDGIAFAILLMNMTVPLIDRYIK